MYTEAAANKLTTSVASESNLHHSERSQDICEAGLDNLWDTDFKDEAGAASPSDGMRGTSGLTRAAEVVMKVTGSGDEVIKVLYSLFTDEITLSSLLVDVSDTASKLLLLLLRDSDP